MFKKVSHVNQSFFFFFFCLASWNFFWKIQRRKSWNEVTWPATLFGLFDCGRRCSSEVTTQAVASILRHQKVWVRFEKARIVCSRAHSPTTQTNWNKESMAYAGAFVLAGSRGRDGHTRARFVYLVASLGDMRETAHGHQACMFWNECLQTFTSISASKLLKKIRPRSLDFYRTLKGTLKVQRGATRRKWVAFCRQRSSWQISTPASGPREATLISPNMPLDQAYKLWRTRTQPKIIV